MARIDRRTFASRAVGAAGLLAGLSRAPGRAVAATRPLADKASDMMEPFGEIGGKPVTQATLRSDAAEVSVLSYGAIVRDWRVTGSDGVSRSVTLGFPTFAPYLRHSRSFGIIAGRIANRVGNATFPLDGKLVHLDRNHGAHHIHGGREGLGRQIWDMEADDGGIRLSYVSPDGHMGYPGRVAFEVYIALNGTALTFTMRGVPDRPTPIALAQHSYYRLGVPVADHVLQVNAQETTVLDADKVPTGQLADVAGTALDFRTGRQLGSAEIDNNLCLDGIEPAATLTSPLYTLRLTTDQPGLQVYTAYDFPQIPVPGLDGVRYGPFAGVALEAQAWPDAVNHPTFPSVIATPEHPYFQRTTIDIAPTR